MTNNNFGSRLVRLMAAVAVIGGVATPSDAKVRAGHQIFEGLVAHVSANNIKVTDPKTKQTISFVLVPHFNKFFKGDGVTTVQEKSLVAGQYVKVYFDQKALGLRHADRILVLNNANMAMKKLKS